ncbi:MAG: DUF2461 domain-containing protein [Candidatus Schekmanbacteria bacterium]|nr:DUF2461 domain-containing protein [Candidatus Schekmanbacteria bacterium]
MHFHQDFLEFFRDLAANNNRDWFQSNKQRYETVVMSPALHFIADFAPHLHQISSHFTAVAKASGGSFFRIHRDTRFSPDKRPYKEHAGIHFRHASAGDPHTPGFYLHLAPGQCGAGIGIWRPDNPTLNRIRGAIVASPDAWAEVKEALSRREYAMTDEDALKKAPAGFPKDHAHVEDLKKKSFAAFRTLSDEEVCAPDFMSNFTAICQECAPLNAFLCKSLALPF